MTQKDAHGLLKDRPDLQRIAGMVKNHSKVLDIGCADGRLLEYLVHQKHVDGRGMELNQPQVSACVGRGLSVIQGNADEDLRYYPDDAFDYVVLSVALQMMQHPRDVLEQMARIGHRVIVSIPNFGYWRNRLYLMTRGRMPVTESLTYEWYETPNIHFCTIQDFIVMANGLNLAIEKSYAMNRHGQIALLRGPHSLANWLSETGIFMLTRQGAS